MHKINDTIKTVYKINMPHAHTIYIRHYYTHEPNYKKKTYFIEVMCFIHFRIHKPTRIYRPCSSMLHTDCNYCHWPDWYLDLYSQKQEVRLKVLVKTRSFISFRGVDMKFDHLNLRAIMHYYG